MEELLESWHINNRINIYLLEVIAEEHLGCKSPAKGRSVGEQFAHMHKARLMWLRANNDKSMKILRDIGKGDAITKDILLDALPQSAQAIEEMVRRRHEAGKQVSGFKVHNAAFISYLVAHESHHRGQIMLILKQAGHPVDKGVAYGMWEWASR